MSISPQTEVKDHPVNLGVTYGQHVASPAVVGFLDRNYRYQSAATQTPHDAGPALAENSSPITREVHHRKLCDLDSHKGNIQYLLMNIFATYYLK